MPFSHLRPTGSLMFEDANCIIFNTTSSGVVAGNKIIISKEGMIILKVPTVSSPGGFLARLWTKSKIWINLLRLAVAVAVAVLRTPFWVLQVPVACWTFNSCDVFKIKRKSWRKEWSVIKMQTLTSWRRLHIWAQLVKISIGRPIVATIIEHHCFHHSLFTAPQILCTKSFFYFQHRSTYWHKMSIIAEILRFFSFLRFSRSA